MMSYAENSDHEVLSQQAAAAQQEAIVGGLKEQLEERRARVQELRKYMEGQVTETQLMQASGMV